MLGQNDLQNTCKSSIKLFYKRFWPADCLSLHGVITVNAFFQNSIYCSFSKYQLPGDEINVWTENDDEGDKVII